MRAVGFDLGHTLIYYKDIPMSWQSLYRQALTSVADECNCKIDDHLMSLAELILAKYNTRLHPRIVEVSADDIFTEILNCWGLSSGIFLDAAQKTFFSYFRREILLYEDTVPILRYFKSKGIKTGILTDVPYGMSNHFTNQDISAISQYVDVLLSSVDVGYRKPDQRGYIALSGKLGIPLSKMLFVGDEPKDIEGANNAGVFSVLIDRTGNNKSYGEREKITSLLELKNLI